MTHTEASFFFRAAALPRLGLGVSTEYGALGSPGALNVEELRTRFPRYAEFLELGVEVARGLDAASRAWVEAGRPTTYHFLDINLAEPGDMDAAWLRELRALATASRCAWLCGDAGLWHFGARDIGHMILLPPVLTRESASALASGVRELRRQSGLEVLPENPPGHVFVGDMHLCDFFTRVAEEADSGLLLDCAHLAIYQREHGHAALHRLADFACERVVEMHVAGSTMKEVSGFSYIEDDHTPSVLPETWEIFDYVVARAPNLKAVVFECERQTIAATEPSFVRMRRTLDATWAVTS